MSSLREMCVADEGKHCPVSCPPASSASCLLLPPAPSPLSMHNVLASFEIYVAVVSWFIFWWPLFTSMTINCHCPSVFMSLGHEWRWAEDVRGSCFYSLSACYQFQAPSHGDAAAVDARKCQQRVFAWTLNVFSCNYSSTH